MPLTQLNLVNTEVRIASEAADFESLSLHQTMTGHHRFSIVVNYRTKQTNVWTTTPETIFQQLGETVNIKFTHVQTDEITEFIGVITNIKVGGKSGDQGIVTLEGGSPTLLLDMDRSMGSFTDYTLGNIVSEVMENSGVTIDLESNPAFTSIIPYAARYKETSFAFMSRLASSCGDWFYYDGQKLLLGNPRIENNTRAAFDMELTEIDITAKLGNLKTEIFDYDPATSDYKEDAPIENMDGINSYMRVARSKSDPFFPNPTKMPTDRFMVDEDDIIAQMRASHSRNYSNMSVFTAKTNTCVIRLGEMVTTRLPESLQQNVGPDLGRYRVLEITHEVNKNGIYHNRFKGVAGLTENLPTHHVQQPFAFSEVATVVENEDPLTQGRIKVRFIWMPEDQASNWIRVQNTNIGSAENNENLHGLMFIPSVDDQVMVAYEHGDPSRPYVAGSVLHRDNATGAQPNDVISKIVSRSGHTIELNDTDGEEKITIYDREQSVIQFNTVDKSIKIQASEDIEMIAKNIKLRAEESIELGATEDVTVIADGAVGLQSAKDTTIKATGKASIEASKDAAIKGMNLTLEGSQNADLKGGAQTNVSGAMAAVKGAAFKVEVK